MANIVIHTLEEFLRYFKETEGLAGLPMETMDDVADELHDISEGALHIREIQVGDMMSQSGHVFEGIILYAHLMDDEARIYDLCKQEHALFYPFTSTQYEQLRDRLVAWEMEEYQRRFTYGYDHGNPVDITAIKPALEDK